MKKTVVVTSVVAVLGVAVSSTFLLPETVTLERRAIVAAAPDAVLGLAASNAGYQRFNPYKNTDPDLKITAFGPATGVGSGFKFDGKDGQGSQTVVEVTPASVGYKIDLGAMGAPRQAITARPHAQGSEVVWSMTMELGNNPLMRVMGLGMDSMMGPILDTGLSNMNAVLKAA